MFGSPRTIRTATYHSLSRFTGSSHAVRGLKKHLALSSPKDYLFEHPKRKGIPMSPTGIRNLLKEAVKEAGIKKEICVHSLRHTYATHQLEAGQNIMTVKDLLGHSCITTTFMYLHNLSR